MLAGLAHRAHSRKLSLSLEWEIEGDLALHTIVECRDVRGVCVRRLTGCDIFWYWVLYQQGWWLVTNAHVLDGCASASVPGYGEATDWKVDKQNDIAVAHIVGASVKATIAMRQSPPRLGEDAAAFGFPLSDVLSDSVKVTTGNINSLVGMENDTRYLQISTPIQPGNSGGPLVDQSGSLLAVTTAQLGLKCTGATGVLPQNVNFAIRSSVLELFLQSREIAYSRAETLGAVMSTPDLADKVAPAVLMVFCHGGTKGTGSPEAVPVSTPPQAATPQLVFSALDNHEIGRAHV